MPAPAAGSAHPLSGNQRLVWQIQRLLPANPLYCQAIAGRILSDLDLHALRLTCQWLVDRHPALRTTFRPRDGEPEQVVHGSQPVWFRIHDARDWSDQDLRQRFDREVSRVFDLEAGPLMRVHLFLRTPGQHRLLLSVHHIVADFHSLIVILDDIRALYPVARSGGSPPAAPSTTYVDFVRWQHALLAGEEGQRQWRFWEATTAAAEPFRLPGDRGAANVNRFAGRTHQFRVPAALTSRLHDLAAAGSATMNVALLTGFQVLLHRWCGQSRFGIRTLVSGRSEPEFARVVGHFANAVPLAADFSDAPSFSTAMARTRRSVALIIEHQDFPLSLLSERCRHAGMRATRLSSDVMFRFQIPHRFRGEVREQRMPDSEPAVVESGTRLEFGGLVAELWNPVRAVAYHALDLELVEAGGEVAGYLHYWPGVFEADTIERLAGDYVRVLAEAAGDPDRPVAAFRVSAGRRAEPVSAHDSAPVPPRAALPPRTRTEERLCLIWQRALGVESVDIHRGFASLGGDSLAAAAAGAAIASDFGQDVPLGVLFESPTVVELAAHVDAAVAARRGMANLG